MWIKGNKRSEETKRKISETLKGKNNLITIEEIIDRRKRLFELQKENEFKKIVKEILSETKGEKI
jgi:hypothetical protein